MDAAKSEILWFLPIEEMYRFYNKSMSDDNFDSGKSLRSFFKDFVNPYIRVQSKEEFLIMLQKQLKNLLDQYEVIPFRIRASSNANKPLYAIFFITSHLKGLEKMVETIWEVDKNYGIGYPNQSLSLFDPVEFLKPELINFLREGTRTNNDIYKFTLRQGYRPRDATQILTTIDDDLKVITEKNTIARKKSYYIGNDQTTVFITLKEKPLELF